MRLHVSHTTTYRYANSVSFSQHVLRLEPRSSKRQRVGSFATEFAPLPTGLAKQHDFFGNAVALMTLSEPHESLEVRAISDVETQEAEQPDCEAVSSWESVRDHCRVIEHDEALNASRFCYASLHTRANDEIEDYARNSFTAGRSMLEAAIDFSHRIHRDFAYTPGATTATTPVAESFAKRLGVCQDFAHVMLAGLRALQLPGRYVSGYLLTRPPEGKPRLVGADASHAWVSVWTPEFGWVDIDPTNDLLPGEEHVAVAWGRDFNDVSPMAGVVIGGGAHQVDVAVDVVPAGEQEKA